MFLVLITNIFKFFLNKKLVVILSVFTLCSFSVARDFETLSPEKAGFSHKKLLKIDKIFIDAIENKEIPGAVIAISRYGKIVYKKAFGMQDPQKKTPMTEDSLEFTL